MENLLRLQQHTRSAEIEEVLGMADDPFNMVYRVYSELTNAELKFEGAVDTAGTPHPVFQSTLLALTQSTDRQRRRTAWTHFYDGYLKMEKTLAALYLANVKQHEFLRKVRSYDSVLEMRATKNVAGDQQSALQAFHNLIEIFKANLPVWHRYWKVKAKLLDLFKLAGAAGACPDPERSEGERAATREQAQTLSFEMTIFRNQYEIRKSMTSRLPTSGPRDVFPLSNQRP